MNTRGSLWTKSVYACTLAAHVCARMRVPKARPLRVPATFCVWSTAHVMRIPFPTASQLCHALAGEPKHPIGMHLTGPLREHTKTVAGHEQLIIGAVTPPAQPHVCMCACTCVIHVARWAYPPTFPSSVWHLRAQVPLWDRCINAQNLRGRRRFQSRASCDRCRTSST